LYLYTFVYTYFCYNAYFLYLLLIDRDRWLLHPWLAALAIDCGLLELLVAIKEQKTFYLTINKFTYMGWLPSKHPHPTRYDTGAG